MSERSSDDVIRMAQEQVAARRAAERDGRAPRPDRERGWRIAFAGLLLGLLLGLVAWPGQPLSWKMYAAVHGVCAQIHNVDVGGMQLPLCARNTGIYMSFTVTTLYLLVLGRQRAGKLPPLPVTVTLGLFVVAMGVDGVNSLMRDLFLPGLYVPRNELRTLTGIGMGVSLGVIMLIILNQALRRDVSREERVLRGWGELAGAVGINLLAWAAIYGNIGVMYWPIAVTAWVGIVGILFVVNLLVTAIAMRYEGAVLRAADLARPGVIALALTVIELGLLGWARFTLDGQLLVG
jgi:uncharacterized membrane protein